MGLTVPSNTVTELPTAAELASWWAARPRPAPRGFWRRLLDGPEVTRPDFGRPGELECAFLVRHRLCYVAATRGALPFPSLPSGSFGIFAIDAARTLSLLQPADGSLSSLFAAEGRALDDAEPPSLARLLCEVWLRRGTENHTVVAGNEALLSFGDDYEVDPKQLSQVVNQVIEPSVQPGLDGWRLRFVTTYGWMHEQQQLGLETINVSSTFVLSREPRRILSERIFVRTPALRY